MGESIVIRDVSVKFPFVPYEIQRNYMEKVIECIQNNTIAVLESPTGTGKTLSLLCSTLGWLQKEKDQLLQDQKVFSGITQPTNDTTDFNDPAVTGRNFLGIPTIIYASRTHSQLSQAVQELKTTAYNNMKCSVLGSRDQLCVHPEVLAESDSSSRINLCRLKIATRTCQFNNRVEKLKTNPDITNSCVTDIEDMVMLGKKFTFCPYYMTKEQVQMSDIIFAPYNYLLDPFARKALGLRLENSIIILDEGHNVEKVCEESASFEIKNSDIALAIQETTDIMKTLSEVPGLFDDSPIGEIGAEELANLKFYITEFEKALDEVEVKKMVQEEVAHFPGDFVFELLEKARITDNNVFAIIPFLDKTIQLLASQSEGPFAKKGKGLKLFSDFLQIVFQSKESKERIKTCYKVHIKDEEVSQFKGGMRSWVSKETSKKSGIRTLSFWCFSPGFGMNFITSQNVKALIITSGTLAPLKPLISELELDVRVRLENPHIVTNDQICVRILPKGPDGEALNSNYQNRDNIKYVLSLGRAILNLTQIIPDGLLIFFPSYPIMQKCKDIWLEDGLWLSISQHKPIFVEPKGKEAFNSAMNGYYEKIADPNLKGAIFMGVCRGKVSEGLDFADANGRAVVITGLPYPPLKEPRVILKKRYLDTCHARDKEYLTGREWYSLEATRAVNQAIGRVIRHKNDYGAILLLDERFNSSSIQNQLSSWLRHRIKSVNKYGEIIRDVSQFFKKAQRELPSPKIKYSVPPTASFDAPKTYSIQPSQCSSTSSAPSCSYDPMVDRYIDDKFETEGNSNGEVIIQPTKRQNNTNLPNANKRKKLTLVSNARLDKSEDMSEFWDPKLTIRDYVLMVKSKLGVDFPMFADHLRNYRNTRNVAAFIEKIDPLVAPELRYVLVGLYNYLTTPDKEIYLEFLRKNDLPIPESF